MLSDRPWRGTCVVAFFCCASLLLASFGGGAVGAMSAREGTRSPSTTRPARPAIAYVTGNVGKLVTIDTSTDSLGKQIRIPGSHEQIAMTRDGSTAWVLSSPNVSITPIDLSTGTVGRAIAVGTNQFASNLAVSPDGRTVYVVTFVTTGLVTGAGSVTPIDVRARTHGPPIPVGLEPNAISVTPDGRTVYVANARDDTVTPIDATTRTAGQPISIVGRPEDIAIAPDGATAYVTSSINWGESGRVTPIHTATNKAGAPIAVGQGPVGIAITPNGRIAYVADGASVWPINLAMRKVGTPIHVPAATRIAITPDGTTAYVAGGDGMNHAVVTPIDLASATAGAEISAGDYPRQIVIAPGRSSAPKRGYYLVASDGGVFTFGTARFLGSTGGMKLNQPIVGMATTRDGRGYWLVASDGGVFSFGDAQFYGSLADQHLSRPIVGIASSSPGGYWLLGADGRVYAFGKARHRGSASNLYAGSAATAIAETPDGTSYLVIASDGNVVPFTGARFLGATGPRSGPPKPRVVGIATTPHGTGYWLVDANGSAFAFGSARPLGSALGIAHTGTVVGASASGARGFWIASSDGGVFSFGTAPFAGSAAGLRLNQPIVGITAAP